LPPSACIAFCQNHREIGEKILRNLAILWAKRLISGNKKIELLTSY